MPVNTLSVDNWNQTTRLWLWEHVVDQTNITTHELGIHSDIDRAWHQMRINLADQFELIQSELRLDLMERRGWNPMW